MVKLIVWDLDNTLWQGIYGEDEKVEPRDEFIDYLKELSSIGIVQTVVSNNEHPDVPEMLRTLGVWDELILPQLGVISKGAAIKGLCDTLQLRQADVLVIDDNSTVLREIEWKLPGLRTLCCYNAKTCSEDFTEIRQVLTTLSRDTRPNYERIDQYRALAKRVGDQSVFEGSNREFLEQAGLHVTVSCQPYDAAQYGDRIIELSQRSNQMNYTKSRLTPESFGELLKKDERMYTVFAYDNYGYHGLIGFAAVSRGPAPRLLHCFFSCRVLHMGVDERLVYEILQDNPGIDIGHIPVGPYPHPFITYQTYEEDLPLQCFEVAIRHKKEILVLAFCEGFQLAHYLGPKAEARLCRFGNRQRPIRVQELQKYKTVVWWPAMNFTKKYYRSITTDFEPNLHRILSNVPADTQIIMLVPPKYDQLTRHTSMMTPEEWNRAREIVATCNERTQRENVVVLDVDEMFPEQETEWEDGRHLPPRVWRNIGAIVKPLLKE